MGTIIAGKRTDNKTQCPLSWIESSLHTQFPWGVATANEPRFMMASTNKLHRQQQSCSRVHIAVQVDFVNTMKLTEMDTRPHHNTFITGNTIHLDKEGGLWDLEVQNALRKDSSHA